MSRGDALRPSSLRSLAPRGLLLFLLSQAVPARPAPVYSSFESLNSTGGVVPETSFNDLAAGVSARVAVNDSAGLSFAGPSPWAPVAGTELLLHVDEGSTASALDSSGKGNHATGTGTGVEVGRFGGAWDFFGDQANGSLSGSPVIRTLQCWFNLAGNEKIGTFVAVGNGTSEVVFGTSNDGLVRASAWHNPTTQLYDFQTVSNWRDGNWHQATLVLHGSSATIYVDGVQQAVAASFAAPLAMTQYRLGEDLGLAANLTDLRGDLDEVRLLSAARTAAQALADFQRGDPYYAQFSTNSGSTWTTVASTFGAGALVSMPGADGALSAVLSASGTDLKQSTSGATGSAGNNEFRFFTRSNVSTQTHTLSAAFAVLADTSAPAAASIAAAATANAGEALLTWSAPADSGLAGLGAYFVHHASFSGFAASTAAAQVFLSTNATAGQAQALVVAGLTPGATRFLRLFSRDKGGFNSAQSNEALAGVRPAAPQAPFTAGPVFRSSVTASWTDAVNGPATTYLLEADGDPGFGSVDASSAATAKTAVVSGLLSNTTYFLRVRARLGPLDSAAASAGSAATRADAPGAPAFTGVFVSSVSASWTSGGSQAGYRLEASTAADFTGTLRSSQTADPGLTSLTVSLLQSFTTHFFRVGALNPAGLADYGASASTRTNGFASPAVGSPPVLAASSFSLSAQWVDKASPPATAFRLEASTDALFGGTVLSSQTALTTATVSGLAVNTTYFLQAFAGDGISTSAPTALGSTSTLAVPIGGGAFPSVQLSSLTVSYASGTAAGGFNPSGTLYRIEASTDAGFGAVAASSETRNLSAVLGGLTPGALQHLRGAAVNHDGVRSTFVSLGSTVTRLSPPGLAAQSFPAAAANGLTAQWTAGASAANPAGTLYDLEADDDPGFGSLNASSTTAALSASVAGLAANTVYFARVRARNGVAPDTAYAALGSTRTLSNPPVGPAFTAVFQSTASASWASGGAGSGYRLEASTAADFTGTLLSSSTASPAQLTLLLSGLAPNTTAFARVGSLNGAGAANFAAFGSTLTRAATPSVAADQSTGTPTSDPAFAFTNLAGFGPGGVAFYRAAWNQNPTHAFTGAEEVWSAGNSTQTATVQGDWFLHVRAHNAAGTAGGSLSRGPYRFTSDRPTGTGFQSRSSTGGPVAETTWGDLAAPATAQLSVQDTFAGLDLGGVAPLAPTAGTVGHWHLDEASGSSALDAGPDANPGSLVGSPARIAGRFGGALRFAGGQSVTGAVSPLRTVSTFEAWVRPNGNNVSGPFASVQAADGSEIFFGFSGRRPYASFFSNAAGSSGSFEDPNRPSTGQWHHIALTVQAGAGALLYVNGAQTAASPTFLGPFTASVFQLGADFGNAVSVGSLADADLDEVRLSSRVLSAAEILSDFQRGHPFYAQYSSDGGATFTTVIATSGAAPLVSLSGVDGSTATQAQALAGASFRESQTAAAGAGATNQVRFFATNNAGLVGTLGPFGVLVDTTAPPAVSNLAAAAGAAPGTAFLSWSSPADSPLGLTRNWWVQHGSTGTFSPSTTTAQVAVSTEVNGAGLARGLLVTGLPIGATRQFALFAGDPTGKVSPASNVASRASLAVPPAGGSVSGVGTGGFTVSYASGTSGTGFNSSAVSYGVEASTDAAFGALAASSQTAALSAAFAGLTPGTTYFLRARAFNAAGVPTAYASLGSALTVLAAPGFAAPSFTAVNVTSVTAQWTSNGNPPPTQYRLEASTASDFTGTLFSSTTAGLSASAPGLTANTTYHFRVRAELAVLTSTYSSLGSASTLANAPAAPAFTGAFVSSAALAWASGAGTNQGYRAELSTAADFTGLVFSSTTFDPAQTTLTVTGLNSGATYFARVGSRNHAGAANFAAAGSTTTQGLISPTPASPLFLAVSSDAATADFTDHVPGGAAQGYRLEASTAPDFSGTLVSSDTAFPLSSATASGLAVNATYYFRAAAKLGAQESAPGFLGSTSTLAVEPAPAAFGAVVFSSLTVSFASGTAAGGFNPAGTLFRLEASEDPGFASLAASSETRNLSALLSGLTPGATHHLRAAAVNHDGVRTAFVSLGSTRTALAPPGLLAPSFPAVAADSATVRWASGTALTAFDPAGTLYRLELDDDPGFGSPVSSTTLGLSAVPSPLLPNTTYFARVRAENDGPASAYGALGSTVTLTFPPGAPAFGPVLRTTASVAWGTTPTSQYLLQVSTDPAFLLAVLSSASFSQAQGTLTVSGLTANATYFGRVATFNLLGAANFASAGSTVTLPAAPSAAANISTGVARDDPAFVFTNTVLDEEPFGVGGVGHYRYAWSQSSTHSFTGAEASWSTGTLLQTATALGSWHLHLKAFNSGGSPGEARSFGPYVFFTSNPVVSLPLTFSSTGAAKLEPEWNDLASAVTGQASVQALFGLNRTGTAAPGPVAGTLGLWHLDEDSGATALDASGAGNDGTLVAAPARVGGAFSGGLSFNGAGQRVLAALAGGGTVRTLECWVNYTVKHRAAFLAVSDGAANEVNLGVFNNAIRVLYQVGGAGGLLDSPATFNDGQWHHVVLALSTSTGASLFVDGALQASNAGLNQVFAPTQLRLGDDFGVAAGNLVDFQGAVDEARLLSFGLSSPGQQGGNPFYVQFSTNGGASFATVASTTPGAAPYVAQTGVDGSTTPQTVAVFNLPLRHSQSFATGSGATNQLRFVISDSSGNSTSSGVFGVLVDTVPPGGVTDLSAAEGALEGQIVVAWSAPGDDGTLLANSNGAYLLRVSTAGPLASEAFFSTAAPVASLPVPGTPGAAQSVTLSGLADGTTYFFALKSRDKAFQLSALSNGAFARPFRPSDVFLNEVFPSSSAAAGDWAELFSVDETTNSLQNWTLTYRQGPFPGPPVSDAVVWTGQAADSIAPQGLFVIVPSANLNGGASHSVILKDSSGNVVNAVQWPVLGAGASFARIEDANAAYLETDPSPTKGLENAVAGAVKLNEAAHGTLAEQFIELYNSGASTAALASHALRNKNAVPFAFSRTLVPGGFTGFTPGSSGLGGTAYAAAFGASGLSAGSDFLALENAAGQVLDRVTWQAGPPFVYRSSAAALVSFASPAPSNVAAPGSIARRPSDGADTGDDSVDFVALSTGTVGAANDPGVPSASNALAYPAAGTVLPRRFKLSLLLGENASLGPNDTVWFIRTGGSADGASPHVYRLSDLGVDLSTTGAQSPILLGDAVPDLDGAALADGAQYRLVLNSDTGVGRAAQVAVANLTYDGKTSTASASANPPVFANAGSPSELAKLTVQSGSPGTANGLELTQVKAGFTDAGGTPLTTGQLQALFSELRLVAASGLDPGTGLYYPALDTGVVLARSSAAFALDGAGFMTLALSTSALTQVPAAGARSFFLAGTWLASAPSASPNTLKVTLDPDADLSLADAPSLVLQVPGSTPTFTSAAQPVISAAGPPGGTTWPRDLGGAASEFQNLPSISFNDFQTAFVGSNDGNVRKLNPDGTIAWSFPTGSPVRTSPIVDSEPVTFKDLLYFADDAGTVYKVRDDGASGTLLWSASVGGPLLSSPVPDFKGHVYVGTPLGEVRKLDDADGQPTSGWTLDPSVTGAVVSEPYVDDFTAGVNALWVATQGGSVYRLRTTDGSVTASLATGGQLTGSPNLWAGLASAANNTNDLYVGSHDGKLRARNAGNLSSVPAGWSDPTASPSGAFRAQPFLNFNEIPILGRPALYAGNDNGRLYKVDASSGGVYWSYQTRGPIRTTPVVVPDSFSGAGDDYVYFGSLDGWLYGLKISDGTLRPGFPVFTGGPVRSSPAFNDTDLTIVVGSGDGKVYSIYVGP